KLLKMLDPATTGLITFSKPIAGFPEERQVVLSPKRDMQEAASNLYAALHRLDAMNLTQIIAERLPDSGLGKTMNERLKKAAARTMAETDSPTEGAFMTQL
ncbi:MAG: hypothetical protein LPK03_08135, partial [Pontibacter sp.]|nr:hypothetical protein [Pontibacter sp.]